MSLRLDTDAGASDGGRGEATPPSRRRHRAVAMAALGFVALAVAATVAVTARPTGDAHGSGTRAVMVAPDGILDLATVSDGVASEFRYAAGHLDAYRQLRCWCGCEAAFDHANLADCFVRADGQGEAHGAGCGVCLASAITAPERLDAGTPISDITAEIDRTFGPDPNFPKEPT